MHGRLYVTTGRTNIRSNHLRSHLERQVHVTRGKRGYFPGSESLGIADASSCAHSTRRASHSAPGPALAHSPHRFASRAAPCPSPSRRPPRSPPARRASPAAARRGKASSTTLAARARSSRAPRRMSKKAAPSSPSRCARAPRPIVPDPDPRPTRPPLERLRRAPHPRARPVATIHTPHFWNCNDPAIGKTEGTRARVPSRRRGGKKRRVRSRRLDPVSAPRRSDPIARPLRPRP